MQLYSARPAQRTRQIVVDVVAVLSIAAFIALGVTIGSLIGALAALGRNIEEAGAGFQGTMSDAASSLGGIPLIGGAASAPFGSASDAGAALAAAGRDQQSLVQTAALVIGLAIAVVPSVVVAVLWLRVRLRFVRRAASSRALAETDAGLELLALRALIEHPRAALEAVPRPGALWRAGDPAGIRRLAEAELTATGVKPSFRDAEVSRVGA